MATSYTQHYGLCQWAPEDKFLREEFNGDNGKIDAALGRVERGLERTGYNLYNLALQSEYDGKQTGYKRALVFDGFRDRSGAASLTAGMSISGNTLSLTNSTPVAPDWGYGTRSLDLQYLQSSRAITAAFDFTVTGFFCKALGTGGKVLRGSLTVNGVGAGNGTCPVPTNEGEVYLPISPRAVRAGDTVAIQVGVADGGGNLCYVRSDANSQYDIGGRLTIEVPRAETGVLTAPARGVGGPWREALAWVRHSGGGVGLTLNGAAMEAGESRSTADPLGRSCTERSFRLTGPGTSPLTVALHLDCQGAGQMAVYSYGVMLL